MDMCPDLSKKDIWVAATLHPDLIVENLGEGLSALAWFIPSRTPPGATCVPRLPDRAALPSRHRWTCTPSVFRR